MSLGYNMMFNTYRYPILFKLGYTYSSNIISLNIYFNIVSTILWNYISTSSGNTFLEKPVGGGVSVD